MKCVAREYPFHTQVMFRIASILTHPLYGKAIGVLLMAVPLLTMGIHVIRTPVISIPHPASFLLLIPLTYGGLFLAAFFHEMGHKVALSSMGCKTKTKLLYNYHNPLLLFNMRTEMIGDHPKHSSSTFLLKRGLSGIAVNVFLNVLFIFCSIYFNRIFFAYLAFLQGFGSQGATSLSPTTGDSDVRTLLSAVEVQDEVTLTVEKKKNDHVEMVFETKLKLQNKIETTYWILVQGIADVDVENSDFLAFDVPDSIMFLLRNYEKDAHILHVRGKAKDGITCHTRGGRIFLISPQNLPKEV